MDTLNTNLAPTKKHFKILDGLRGVAALAIVVFHFAEWIYADYTENFIIHGFLAVDFFFCLSGFVVAYAYDNRLEEMGILGFFKRRLIRLHPLVILGTVLGLIAFLFDPFSHAASLYDFGRTALIFICSLFLIPLPVMEERSLNNFGLNAPSWSLFWEYIANIAYVFIFYKLNRYILSILAIIAAIGLIYIAYHSGNLLGGWNGDTFWHGGVRIAFSFLAGLLIYRNNWILKNNIGFIGLSLLLLFALFIPHFGFNWLVELVIVLFYFPLLVSLGAGSTLSPQVEKACEFSGSISYPLYMTHYAGIWIFGNYFLTTNPDPIELTWVIVLGTLFMALIAYLVLVFYDIPLRKYLTKRLR
ncbi:acyltransferase [Sphingobacterium sp. SGG-5]|nr:acyltransferase [Sphingobacterium sp. SGG-5]